MEKPVRIELICKPRKNMGPATRSGPSNVRKMKGFSEGMTDIGGNPSRGISIRNFLQRYIRFIHIDIHEYICTYVRYERRIQYMHTLIQ